eukprot:ANDGO_07515.mRNA.1 hypothetical protein
MHKYPFESKTSTVSNSNRSLSSLPSSASSRSGVVPPVASQTAPSAPPLTTPSTTASATNMAPTSSASSYVPPTVPPSVLYYPVEDASSSTAAYNSYRDGDAYASGKPVDNKNPDTVAVAMPGPADPRLSDGKPKEGSYIRHKKTKLFLSCFLGFILSIATVALILFFIFPRIPKIKEKNVSESVFTLRQEGNNFVIQYDLDMFLNIQNDNYFKVEIQKLLLKATHSPSGLVLFEIEKGSESLPAKKTTKYVVKQKDTKTGPEYSAVYTQCVNERVTGMSFLGSVTIKYIGISFTLEVPLEDAIPCVIANVIP